MYPRMRNEYGVSNNVICGICLNSGHRDDIKRFYFPRKHLGKIYVEKGTKLAYISISEILQFKGNTIL